MQQLSPRRKPSDSAIFSGHYLVELLREAGLPDGVINFVPACGLAITDRAVERASDGGAQGDPELVTRTVLADPNLAAIHYTGSTAVLRQLFAKVPCPARAWRGVVTAMQVGENMGNYRSFPRIVGAANLDRCSGGVADSGWRQVRAAVRTL
jgi:1-pyrroline-5-carboxylate dehydrogenase